MKVKIIMIEEGFFEYGNFKTGKFDSKLISKILRLASLKISNGNFKFYFKSVNFKNIVRNYVHNQSVKSSSQQFG